MEKRVRAMIVQNGKLLTIKRVLPERTFWVIPGGGVEETDEDEEAAITRECEEEINVKVRVGKLIWEREFKGYLEHFYLCYIVEGEVGRGNGPEYGPQGDYTGTHEPEWVDLKKLESIDLKPEVLRDDIINKLHAKKSENFSFEEADWSALSR